MKYRLIPLQKTPVTLLMFPKTVNGRVSYSHYMRLEPDTLYETDDEAQKEYLRTHTEKVQYTAELEHALKEQGIPYEVAVCRACGGRVRKIQYRIVEVVEDE